jgi:glutamate synthase (NADPH/NADH) small chain
MWPSKERGFKTFQREIPSNLPVEDRVKNFEEFTRSLPEEQIRQQAYRCMNCGVPFCHSGCPLGNTIPDINAAIKDARWRDALDILHSTNNFPEFTGRVCPALCEAACVLGINESPVTIEYLEREVVERGWKQGWIKPEPAKVKTGKKVAVVGAGPSGLAAAQQLARAGHDVTVFERDDEPGGLLIYGIPTFKLSKTAVRRRVEQMKAEGVDFRCKTWVGKTIQADDLAQYDAVLLTLGSTKSRMLDIPGADLDGIHLAVPFLKQQTKRFLGKEIDEPELTAKDKNVVVIGGGDTGSDCIGTSLRQGAKQVYSLEIMPKPPLARDETMPWPQWPFILRTSTSHEEGGVRQWSILTKKFEGQDGHVTKLHAVHVEWYKDEAGFKKFKEVAGSEFAIDCDLVLLALGFLHPEQDTIVQQLGLELDQRGNIKTKPNYQTSSDKVFAAGDARRGQSLVVWALREGREAARCIDLALMGRSDLPGYNSYGYDALGA